MTLPPTTNEVSHNQFHNNKIYPCKSSLSEILVTDEQLKNHSQNLKIARQYQQGEKKQRDEGR